MIEVENLKKTFRKKVVLNEIGFKTQGRIVGLLGPNGSGKTTLLRILAGIIKRYDGNIIFKDLSGNTINPKECKIGYLLLSSLFLQFHLPLSHRYGVMHEKTNPQSLNLYLIHAICSSYMFGYSNNLEKQKHNH